MLTMPWLAPEVRRDKKKMRFLVVGMHLAGMKLLAISNSLGIPKRTVSFWLRKFRVQGDVEDEQRTGRPRATSSTADRRLLRMCRANRFTTSALLLADWNEQVTARTVRNRLKEGGLFSRKPIRKPKLSPCHRAIRLRWAMARCHFREPQWSRIIFSDEARFLLFPVDGRVRVWRATSERLAPNCIVDSVSYGGGSVHVWGAISTNSRSELVILRQTLNGERYKLVLKDHLLTWASVSLGNPQTEWKLQEDNAPAHRARSVQAEKERLGIRSIPWPSKSPDLNPIEHVWSKLGLRILRRSPRPTSLANLATVLKEEWNAIPQAEIASLISSMPRRVNAVITAQGGPTPY